MSDSPNLDQSRDSGDRAGADYWDGRLAPSAPPSGKSLKDRLRRFNTRGMDRMLSKLLSGVSEGERILELGCAPGWIRCRLHRLRPDLQLAGIDYAAQGVKDTRSILKKTEVAAEIREADISTYEAPSPYDAVISCGLVEHFDKPEQIVAHHARLVRPGGLVIITVPNFRNRWLGRAFKWLSPDEYATHNIQVMSPQALHDLAKTAGLTEIRSGGGAGPALYTSPRTPPRPFGRIYLLGAKAWNLCTAALPDRLSPWHSHLWVIGRVPGPAQPPPRP